MPVTVDNINPYVCEAKYAVRGELAVRAETLRETLAKGGPDAAALPFESTVAANIGNPQQLDQKPLTFFRQVLSLLEYPKLLEGDAAQEEALTRVLGFPSDVLARARKLKNAIGSLGAYSHSQGVPEIRESVARFLECRDGFKASAADIYLTAGASSGVQTLLTVLCGGGGSRKGKQGVLVPIPQYPLYTATLALLGAEVVPYYLNESSAWGTDVAGMRTAFEAAKACGVDVRAIVVINPGNPTGASLSAADIDDVLALAAAEDVVVMADEVYQTNVFAGEFISFKRRLRELQLAQAHAPGRFHDVQLASLHSVSKGMVGECGHRGGYFELIGWDPAVVAQIYKFVSIGLCPPVTGQCLVELMVNPPVPGEPSYELYKQEYDTIAGGMRARAYALWNAFKEMEGVHCQEPQVCSPSLCLDQLPLSSLSRLCSHQHFNPTKLTPPSSTGCHVPLSLHHRATQGRRRCRRRAPLSRRVLLLPPARGDGHLRRSWVRIRTEGRHPAFPHHLPAARDGLGRSDPVFPRGVHGGVPVEWSVSGGRLVLIEID